MDKWLVIADDFTGANDTGVQLTKRGFKTQVVLNGRNIKNDGSSYVLDTESRGKSNEDAYESLKNHIKNIFDIDYDLIYKKVDSTLRGNIGAEVKAIYEEYKPELVIFAPAFPIIGRTTVDGIHFVDGKRILETEFAKDPIKPVLEEDISKLIQFGFEGKVIHHKLKEIRDGEINFSKSIVHSFDAENNDDLEKIISSVIATKKKILWVGSAGMADIILKIKKPLKPALALIGSLSQVAKKQIRFAEEKGIKVLKVSISESLESRDISEYVKKAKDILSRGEDLIITSSYDNEDYLKAIEVGKSLSMSTSDISLATQEILGQVGKETIENKDIAGVFVTGGDTAIGFINSTNALGSSIIEEIITGIPLMRLNGGKVDGLKMVSKAGAFGNEDALFYSIGKLKEVK